MAENIFFPERFAQSCGLEGPGQGETESPSPEAQRHLRSRVRLREIEAAGGSSRGFGKKGHIFGRTADRIIAARSVGSLVRQAKGRNVTVRQIQAEFGGSGRIDRYMLSPEIDASEAEAKCGKLLQQVAGYLRVAEAVAKLTRQDPDALKIQILSGTSLWSNPSTAQTEDDPRATHLAAELIEMGRAVVRRTGLKDIISRARRVPGLWEIENELFVAARASGVLEAMMREVSGDEDFVLGQDSACLPQDFYLDLFLHWTEAPPLPSVPIVRCLHAILYPPSLRVETAGHDERLTGELARDTSFKGDERAGVLELWRETRLALGPITSAYDVGPMFETRAHLVLTLVEPSVERYELSPSHTLKPIDTLLDFMESTPPAVFQAWLGGAWRRVAMVGNPADMDGELIGDAEHPLHWRPNPMDPDSPVIEHWYPSWSAINSESVKYWVDRPLAPRPETQVATPEDGDRADKPVWYVKGSTAHLIERALASGGLEVALEAAVCRVSDALDQREAEWRDTAMAAHEARMIRWQQETGGEQ